jgi:DNA-binding protein H-NS
MRNTSPLKVIERKIKELQAQAQEIRRNEREGIEQLRAVIGKYKLGLAHLKKAMEGRGTQRGMRTRAKSKTAPKYRSPDNAAVVWSGRGRRPAWLVAALNDGRTIDEFRIRHTQEDTSGQPSAVI